MVGCADARHQVRESNESNNCAATRDVVKVRASDRTPPTFGGLTSGTTCIPGPVGGGRSAPFHLSWNSATDDVTPSSAIVYDIYEATIRGSENYSLPTYTAPAGAAMFTTPPLAGDQLHYFVVRARDRAGNRDSNEVERPGMNLCV